MSKLLFHNVRFKNFLSFGNKWQEIKFLNGINVITGKNGSGKSSCMETIPFALFGKTHKEDIKKENLINWKNKKALEVQLEFSKNNDEYRIVRAIKPDNFEIYKNGDLIDKLSHVRDYQSLLEDIIGTNIQIFSSLIHSNINTSTAIFSMSKPDKRKFIERVFSLTIYSKLSDACTKKLQSINNGLREIEIDNVNNNSVIEESKRQIESMKKKISSMKSSDNLLNESKLELKELLADIMDEEKYERMIDRLSSWSSKVENIENILSKVHSKRVLLNSKIKDLTRRMPDEVKYVDEKCFYLYEENIKNTNQKQSDLKNLSDEVLKLKHIIKTLKDRRNLIKNGVCPTCGQSIHSDIINTIDDEIDNALKEYDKNETKGKEINGELENLKNIGIELLNKIDELKKYKNIESERQKITNKLKQYKGAYSKIDDYHKKVDDKRITLNNKLSLVTEEYEKEKNKRIHIEKIKSEIKSIEDRVSLEESTKDEFKSIISSNMKSIEDRESKIQSNKQSIERLNDMKDYLEYIKVICKDENIKAKAISSIIPVLTKNVNKYLSDIGRPFYIKMDSWLQPTIKGPGISSGVYGSLSSGEAKSVDVALQIAFLDIARIQSGVYPDILIFDELLDSSVDSDSLNTLLQIVNKKQQEDNSKVYIISHRDMVNEMEGANLIKVIKEGGYSKIVV